MTPVTPKTRTALVFGASGITGWAILNEAVSYPSRDTFSRIIGLTNQPTSSNELYLPTDERIILASGVNLMSDVDIVAEQLKKIAGIENVTDVFFSAYVQPPGTSDIEGWEKLLEANVKILETAVRAVELVSNKLRFWSLQTGGKVYGAAHVAYLGLPEPGSYSTESDPRIPEPYASQLFYYAQADALTKLSAGKAWKFTEIRPNEIIGLVPKGNSPMNLAQALAVFISFFASRSDRKERPKLAFPGDPVIWTAQVSDISQRTLARAHIFAASLETVNGEIFNVSDNPPKKGSTWQEKWPLICEYFGVEGVGPGEIEGQHFGPSEYMLMHESEWESWEANNGLRKGIIKTTGWEFADIMLRMAVFDRVYDTTKFMDAGFSERVRPSEAYIEAFQRMEKAKIIPVRRNQGGIDV